MLVDTHAHLMDSAFGDDLPEVLGRAEQAGVIAVVCVGYDEASSLEAVALSERYPRIVAAVGIHPNYAAQAEPAAFQRIRDLARHPRVVGIGETGLDEYRQFTPGAVQREWFARHLELAAERDLPVIVHNRQADDEMARMLSEWQPDTRRPVRGVLHCFSGGADLLRVGLEAGFAISFAGPLTFKNAGSLRERALEVPLDRVVLETDCPYLAPEPCRGRRNEPAFVLHTARRLADLRGITLEEIGRATTQNARRLFGDRLPAA